MQQSLMSIPLRQLATQLRRVASFEPEAAQRRIFAYVAPIVACLGVVTGAAVPATAQEACVTCDAPFAIYRCQVDSPDLVPSSPVQFLCIKELAKRFGHQTCSVMRKSGTDCAGEVVVVTPADALPAAPPQDFAEHPDDVPGPVTPGEQEAIDAAEREKGPDQVAEPSEPGPPETVEDLAKQTVAASEKGLKNAGKTVADAAKNTGKTIEKTGEAIGSAAQKTWKCLSSFFGDC
ncbi:MAG: hypothetical protein RIC14_13405 [Filomicrobium sp.]